MNAKEFKQLPSSTEVVLTSPLTVYWPDEKGDRFGREIPIGTRLILGGHCVDDARWGTFKNPKPHWYSRVGVDPQDVGLPRTRKNSASTEDN